jgi:hypothetical protein
MTPWSRQIAWVQGLYFTALGVWPVLDIASFEAVTGKKTDHLQTGLEADHWLVYTVGLLISAIGFTLLFAAWRHSVRVEMALLGALSAFLLAAIDLVYVARETIRAVYLVDAAAELAFVTAWVVAVGRSK